MQLKQQARTQEDQHRKDLPTGAILTSSAILLAAAELLPEATVEATGKAIEESNKANKKWSKLALRTAAVGLGGLAIWASFKRRESERQSASNEPRYTGCAPPSSR